MSVDAAVFVRADGVLTFTEKLKNDPGAISQWALTRL